MKVAFLGLGNMGLPMALNLIQAGYQVQGFDLVRDQLNAFKDKFAVGATSKRWWRPLSRRRCWGTAAQVAGDECSNAIVVTANTPVSVNTATMTASASPPSSIIGPCEFMNWGATTKDAWFRFDAPANGRLTAILCGSDYDTSVVMYQGSCGSLFRIACDDDDCQPGGPT
jgi:hypothetical protein